MLGRLGVNVQIVFAITFAIGAGMAASPAWRALRCRFAGEDTRYLLASLVV